MEYILITLIAFTPLLLFILVNLSLNPLEYEGREYVYYDMREDHLFVLPTKMSGVHMRMNYIEFIGEL